MPARPSRNAAVASMVLRQTGFLKRTIATRQTSAITARAAANGNTISETTVTAIAASDGQSFRRNDDIDLGVACTGSRAKHQWGWPERAGARSCGIKASDGIGGGRRRWAGRRSG